jgi:transposase
MRVFFSGVFLIKLEVAGIPLLRIASANARRLVGCFEQREALVPETNAQMTSGSRLYYRPFGGTKPACQKIHTGGCFMSDVPGSVAAEPEWAAFVAIDWADKKHCWKLLAAGSEMPESGTLENTPEALSVWAANLQERFGGRPIAVGLEQSRGSLVYALCKYPQLVLYPIHSTTAARYRQAFFPSGSKDDPVDTTLLLELLTRHRDSLRRLDPETPETRLLQMLVEQRRKLVDERTGYSNQLTAWLKLYFPQVLSWIDNIDSAMGCDLLERWPSLEQLQRVNPAKLRDFFTTHNCRSAQRIQERIDAIYQAIPAVKDTALLEAGPASVQALAQIIKALNFAIANFDQRIESAANNHPEAPLFTGLPGAGPALRPRLIAAFGTQRQRYHNAGELQSYAGIAPVTERSGGTQWIHVRRACPKFLRQTFHEFASHSIRKSTWARAYYRSQRDLSKSHHAAVRALAFKWIRVLYACWRDRQPYDEATYASSLEKRNSPLAKLTTALQWNDVAGFKKLSKKNT